MRALAGRSRREQPKPLSPVRINRATCNPIARRRTQKATWVRIANALNFEPASPKLVGLICLATSPCR